MKVDADGAPNAYGPNNSGLDYTANAGHPGNWWGVVTDKKGNPVIQGPNDPFPGKYVSTTSLVDKSKKLTDPGRYVDSRFVPYIVHYSSDTGKGSRVGDIATIVDTESGDVRHGTVADYRGSGQGEASMYMASLFGVNSNPKTGGTTSKRYCYIIWDGFSQGWPVHNATILREGARRYRDWQPTKEEEKICKCPGRRQ